MIVVLTGDNDYARLSELKKIESDFVLNQGDFGLERIDAGSTDAGRILETVAAQPFLAPRRMVVIRGIQENKALAEDIGKLLDVVSDDTDLVISEPRFDKRLTLYKILKKRTDFREYASIDERGLSGWLVKEASARGGSLGAADANYLVQRSGRNQMVLSSELEKLLSFDPKITRTAIDELIEETPQSKIFDLLDAAFAGHKKRAMELYADQRKQQAEPQMIMGMIAWQIHALAVVKFNEKDGSENIARAAKMSPFIVQKSMSLTRKMPASQIRSLVARALRLDVRLKSENIDADDAVQHFLLTI